jgi:hypothetical protein
MEDIRCNSQAIYSPKPKGGRQGLNTEFKDVWRYIGISNRKI